MRSSVIISALVAVLVGFGGSVAVVLAAAQSVGATPEQTSSWIAALCVAMACTTGFLSVHHRLPIVTAWSTPGAALVATTSGVSMSTAVGAFLLYGVLVLLTAAFRPLNTLIEKIPASIASAMLAGVLFGFVVAIFGHIPETPYLVLPLLVAFVLLRPFSPAWAVLAVLALGVVLSSWLGLTQPLGPMGITTFVFVRPEFDPATLVGLGIPIYLVTMASQNLPGFAVLRSAGYPVPSRSILTVTGLASLATAMAGAHTINLAAITASICTGADAHPDKDKRWLCGPFYAAGYAILAVFGASVVTVFASFPQALVATVAGIALAGPLLGALSAALEAKTDRFAAVATFCVTAAGLTAFGIGSAFWGLLAGLFVYGVDRLFAGHTDDRDAKQEA
ncbi:MAG: benzoate/H(+) symporter BenE family transporter [Hyphomicrobiaceae bacterium]